VSRRAPRLSVVIPTLDESEWLGALLGDIAELAGPHEVIVVDGGSTDGTVEIAIRAGAQVITSQPGRGLQLRAGVGATEGRWLLIMHADCRLPREARAALTDFLRDARDEDFAHFEFALEGKDAFWRFIEFGQRVRERMYGLVYGDQGLVVSRTLYDAVGGYAPWPVMEDVGMFNRLRRAGRGRRLGAPVVTSPRRYQGRGRWSQWMMNIGLITLFRLGVNPRRLARWYPADESRTAPARPDQAIVLFAKAPRLGFVKTRLARDVGQRRALEIYRALGSRVAKRMRRTGRRVIVYFTPADAENELRDWLGDSNLEFRPQCDGDLGARMVRAFEECLSGSISVCIVGTDVPGLVPSTLETAFDLLSGHDVVLGPAEDGGYYLVGLREPRSGLFDGVPWSTGSVFDVTHQRAAETDLTVAVVDRLADVDTVDDVPADLWAEGC
jgi:rSAM/selenodomain-associated transferase 2/rSAM/selenodomain-associated transferase 1